MEDLKYWLAFSQFPKIGPKKFAQIRQYFPSLKYAWEAFQVELVEAGLPENLVAEFIAKRRTINPDSELEKLNQEKLQVVRIIDDHYPKLLREIYNPPYLLYYKGDLNNLNEHALGVVGTRKITNYGRQATELIVSQLIEQNFIIVSGLALGVDAVAHHVCVQHKKTTVAVLGGGLDRANVYPSANRFLAENILQNNGLIISEFAIGTIPTIFNFPLRNRIISGLSKGVLVIEAGESSGALITAKFALDQNREVFAIPGPITNNLSTGTNNLIKAGAKLVANVQDILEEFNLQEIIATPPAQKPIADSPEEALILRYLQNEPRHINELVRLTNLSVTEINSTLMLLEMKNVIQNLGNMTYIIKT
jgi:DNA processing protein